jgi:DNA-binding transcriptional LysR family regulator
LVDRVVNMTDEGVDVAVRIGDLHEPAQQAIRVGEVRRVVCASPGYLDEYGRPEHPGQLGGARIISLSSGGQSVSEWAFVQGDHTLTVPIEPRLVVSANNAAISLARLGWGMTRVLSYQVAAAVAAGELEIVLEAYEPAPLPIQVVFQNSGRVPAKVSTFVDFLSQRLGQDAALQRRG